MTSSGASPYTFSVTSGSLPAGLTLSSSGVLSGTPSSPGTANFTVTATDSGGCTGSWAYSVITFAHAGTITDNGVFNPINSQINLNTFEAFGAFANSAIAGKVYADMGNRAKFSNLSGYCGDNDSAIPVSSVASQSLSANPDRSDDCSH
jgi:hypothetical protein